MYRAIKPWSGWRCLGRSHMETIRCNRGRGEVWVDFHWCRSCCTLDMSLTCSAACQSPCCAGGNTWCGSGVKYRSQTPCNTLGTRSWNKWHAWFGAWLILQQSLLIVIVPDLIICGHFDNVLFFVFSLFVVLRWFRNRRFESGPADVEVSSYHVVRHLTVLFGITQRLGRSELTKDALGQCAFTWGRSLLSPLMQVQVARQHVGGVELWPTLATLVAVSLKLNKMFRT